jgi:hypothetical protein
MAGGVMTTVTGTFKQIDSGDYRVVAVNTWGDVYIRTEITKENPMGADWSPLKGHMFMASTSARHVVWGIDRDDKVWFHKAEGYENKIPPLPMLTEWEEAPLPDH